MHDGSTTASSHQPRNRAPVRCHRCPALIEENGGYWFALSPQHVTADDLPIAGHLYCETCVDKLYEEAVRLGGASFVTKFLKKRRQPGRYDTALQAGRHMAEGALSKEQWKSLCHDQVAWWWERRRLVQKGMIPPWADASNTENVIGKYRIQLEPWKVCLEACELANETQLAETVARFDDLIRRFVGFAAYGYYCRGVWLQSLVRGESGTRGLARASAILDGAPEFRGAIWLGTPSSKAQSHAQAAKSDLSRALELDPQLNWAYFYRAHCADIMGDRVGVQRDFDRALDSCPSLRGN